MQIVNWLLLFDIHICHVLFYHFIIWSTFRVNDNDIWVAFLQILVLKVAIFWRILAILMTLIDDLGVFLALELTCERRWSKCKVLQFYCVVICGDFLRLSLVLHRHRIHIKLTRLNWALKITLRLLLDHLEVKLL